MHEQPVMIRNSERSSFRRCRQRWFWSYVLLRRNKRRSGALTFGDLIHQALAKRYRPGAKRGPLPARTFMKLFQENASDFSQWDEDGNRIPADELGAVMLHEYVKLYGKDEHIKVIHPEMHFAVDVYDRRGRYLCTIVGSVDCVIENLLTGRKGLWEHKTAKAIEQVQVISGYGEQALSYLWGMTMWLRHLELLGEDERLEMVMFNFLKKSLPDERPTDENGMALNQNGTVSKRQPPPRFDRQEFIVDEGMFESFNRRIRAEAWEMIRAREGKAPIYKNPTKDCSWDCEFYDVCEIHEMGGDWEGVLDLEFVAWDPYADYREDVFG